MKELKAILIFLCFAFLLFLSAQYFQRQNSIQFEKLKETDSTTIDTFDYEKDIELKIKKEYNKIDSLIIARDSIKFYRSTKPGSIQELQRTIDSLFNK